MRQWRIRILILLAGLTTALSMACTTAGRRASSPPPAAATGVQEKIKPLVASLYLKTKDLEAAYKDLRTVANAQAFLSDDRQLSHIQKAALYVQNALQEAFHQWEFLSIMGDIKPSARQDYFTLRGKALKKAADDTGYDVRFLKLYQVYITNAEAEKDILHALSVIEDIQKIYDQLIDGIVPMVRQGRPTPV